MAREHRCIWIQSMPIALLLLLLSFVTLSASQSCDYRDKTPYTNCANAIKTLHDPDKIYTLKTLPLKEFIKPTKSALGYKKGLLWSHFTLQNATKETKKVLIVHPKPNINAIDVTVFEDGTLLQHHTLGNRQTPSSRQINSKYSTFKLTIEPNKRYEIISAFESKSPLEVTYFVTKQKDFISFIVMENMLWGLFGGLVFALVIYNFSMYISLREGLFLAYVFHGVAALIFQFSTNGIFYQFELYENLELFNSISWLSAQISILAILSFSIFYFETKKNFLFIHKSLLVLLGLSFSMLMLFVYSLYEPTIIGSVNSFTKPLSLFIILYTFIVAILAAKKKIIGSYFYLFGHGFFILTLINQQIGGVFNIEVNFFQNYATAVGILVEIIFLSLGLGEKIKRLKKEKERSDNLLLIESGFSAVGKFTGALTHQLKIPIVQLGTLVTNYEALLWSKKIDDKELLELKIKMRDSINFAIESQKELSAYYKNESKVKLFCVYDALQEVINMLRHKLDYTNTTLLINIEREITICGNKNAFLHICLILLDNALDTFRERTTSNPSITITLSQKKDSKVLTVKDNGGGIFIRPIESVFDAFITNKESGSGMGLSIAYYLAKERLGAEIKAKNVQGGALFTLTFF